MQLEINCMLAPAARPTDPRLAFPIFRNGNITQLVAAAELKASEAGHEGAYSHVPLRDGEFAHVRPRHLSGGGPSEAANAVLPESILRLRGRRCPSRPTM